MKENDLFTCDNNFKVVFPPEEVLINNNYQELEEWARKGLSLTDHYNGTCALGKVVDPNNFKIYGTKNIYVADASTFPEIPNANTEFPVAVMATIASKRISKNFK